MTQQMNYSAFDEVLQQPEFNRAITFLITQFGQTVGAAVEVALADEQARLQGTNGRALG